MRAVIVAGASLCAGCGRSPSSPSAQEGLVLTLSRGAAFIVDRGGGPGLIRYTGCYWVRVPEALFTAAMTIRQAENWTIGPDGSVYDHHVDHQGRKIGGATGTVGIDCEAQSIGFDDRDIARPTATAYRVQLEYTFDNGSPAGVRVLTGEAAVDSRVPPRPLMTSLAMTSNLAGRPPRWDGRNPMRFAATGGGGTSPYQFQWRYGNNVVLRDWSPDPTFVWDGTVPGATSPAGSVDVTAMARSAGGTEPEVMTIRTIFLR